MQFCSIMPALVAGIHAFRACAASKTWMPATSPAMTALEAA
jgi:hypothetical protein